jgi:transposase-like protein
MPRTRNPYPAEFREQMVALARSGRSVEELAREFEPCAATIHGWLKQTDRDGGHRADGVTSEERELRRSLTWDQGAEMAQHDRLKIDSGVQVYFCDPQSPWQRGTNENTNGLLRQYFPKGTDLSIHSADEIAAVAAALNARPRKTLGWKTPAEALDEWLR